MTTQAVGLENQSRLITSIICRVEIRSIDRFVPVCFNKTAKSLPCLWSFPFFLSCIVQKNTHSLILKCKVSHQCKQQRNLSKNVFISISHYVEYYLKYRISGFANKHINHFVFFFLFLFSFVAVVSKTVSKVSDSLKAVDYDRRKIKALTIALCPVSSSCIHHSPLTK